LSFHFLAAVADPAVVVDEERLVLPERLQPAGIGLDPMVGDRVEHGQLQKQNGLGYFRLD